MIIIVDVFLSLMWHGSKQYQQCPASSCLASPGEATLAEQYPFAAFPEYA